MNDFSNYIQQGLVHVLDLKALDHVLFFIALTVIFKFKNWKKALLLITFFTIGHTLTFGLSVFDYIFVKSKIVEFLIPITIAIPLIINIYKVYKHQNLNNTNIYFSFFFGLVHGLGFSSYFLMRIDSDQDKLVPLLKFALGIELAQIIIVFCVLGFAYLFQEKLKIKQSVWIVVISVLVLLIILPMLYKRALFLG